MIELDADEPVPFSEWVLRIHEIDALEGVFIHPGRPLTTDSLTVASGPMLGRETIEKELGFAYVGEVSTLGYLLREHGSDLDGVLKELEKDC